MKQLVATLVVAAMAMTMVTLITTHDAEAQRCDLVLEPFVANDGGFNPALGNAPTITGSDLVAFQGGSIADTLADAQNVLTNATLPADIRAFYVGLVAWLGFLGSNACAPALPYPGPFENMPAGPSSPYGFGGVAAGSASWTPVAAAAPVAATSVPATGGGLAHTGAESDVLAFVGVGLLGFGALAMGSRRRIS